MHSDLEFGFLSILGKVPGDKRDCNKQVGGFSAVTVLKTAFPKTPLSSLSLLEARRAADPDVNTSSTAALDLSSLIMTRFYEKARQENEELFQCFQDGWKHCRALFGTSVNSCCFSIEYISST